MRCLSCHHPDTKVTDSRLVADGMAIRRRRECIKCGFRFSTYEESEILNLSVVKRNGSREPYIKEKIEAGIRRSFEKLPITEEQFKQLISRIERDIQTMGKQEVTSQQIGEMVMKHLRRANHVAYIRFASVYRSFTDLARFQEELKSLQAKKKSKSKKITTRKRK